MEGSEFAFLQSAIDDFDCPPVDQMTVEWHHYNFDPRYGGGSSPEINVLATYIHDRCNMRQYQVTRLSTFGCPLSNVDSGTAFYSSSNP